MFFASDDIKIGEDIIPSARVSAFANRELAEFLKEHPIVIDEASKVNWKSSTDGQKVYAEGSITIPLKMVFKPGNLRDDIIADDLVFIDLEVDGKSQYGIRFEKPVKEAPLDPLDTVDIPRTIAQAQKEHWS